jgi:murein DD-endopeptidase MepM/ murein hydrolase activator NlpD
MKNESSRRVRDVIDRLFPERQIFYRTGGEVVFVRLGRPLQMGLALVLLAFGGWVVYASANLYFMDEIIAAKERRYAEIASAYDDLDDELKDTEARFLSITTELEDKHAQLVALMDHSHRLRRRLSQATIELEGVAAERDRFVTMKETLDQRIGELENRLQSALDESEAGELPKDDSLASLERRLENLISERDQARQEGAAMAGRVADLKGRVDTLNGVETRIERVIAERDVALDTSRNMADRVENLQGRVGRLAGVENRLENLIVERDVALLKSRQMADRVAELETRLSSLRSSQNDLINRIQEQTEVNLSEIEEMIALTGLDVDALLKDAPPHEKSGLGGPFIGLTEGAMTSPQSDFGDAFMSSVVKLEQHLNRWSGLQSLVQQLPMTSPLDTYYVASKYGKRRDPFSKKWAMHNGVDLAGPFKTKVWSPAPGKVTFVGRKGPYGRTIEIDHGFGLKTRYGHLHKILVKKGAEVGFRHKIGLMGSTGRSTGAHVHYEILYNGKPQDPAKFLKAGKYVFKG